MTIAIPTAADFQPFLGATLCVRGAAEPAEAQLVLQRVDIHRLGFALLLRGPAAPVLAEGLHTVILPNGVHWDLYMMPVHTPASNAQDYQIVCN